ncbi:MAG: GNAT family N-acetyltransferase [Acidobacteriota bacterium]
MASDLSLRPVTEEDRPFLLELYAGTREQELSVTDWTPEQKFGFCAMQFHAQDVFYRENYPGAELSLILANGDRAGRLYIHRRLKEIRLMDIAIAAAHRNRGIGTAYLNRLIGEATAACLPLTIHVEQLNPALRLYERLGFKKVGENSVYFLMEYLPPGATPGPAASLPAYAEIK